MKHQQVVVDYWNMIKTSFTCLLLALSGYILIKMVQTIFWLPSYLQKNQKRLEELAAQYSLDLEGDKNIADILNAQLDEAAEDTQPLLTEQSTEDKIISANAEPKVEEEPKKHK